MNIANLMPRFGRNDHEVDSSFDEAQPQGKKAPTHGPQRLKFMTNGQFRRQLTRDAKSRRRKDNRRYRRDWMRGQLGIAVLRGQLETATSKVAPVALARNAQMGLVAQFGEVDQPWKATPETIKRSIQKGREAYDAVLAG